MTGAHKKPEKTYSQGVLVAVGLVCFVVGLAAGGILATGQANLNVTRYVPPTRRASVLAAAQDVFDTWMETDGPAQYSSFSMAVNRYQRLSPAERGPDGAQAVAQVAVFMSYPEGNTPLYLQHVAFVPCSRYGLFVECSSDFYFELTEAEQERQRFTQQVLSNLADVSSVRFTGKGTDKPADGQERPYTLDGAWTYGAMQLKRTYEDGEVVEEVWADGQHCIRRGESAAWTCQAQQAPDLPEELRSAVIFQALNETSRVVSANLYDDTLEEKSYRVYSWDETFQDAQASSCSYELWVSLDSKRPARLLTLSQPANSCRRWMLSGDEEIVFEGYNRPVDIQLPPEALSQGAASEVSGMERCPGEAGEPPQGLVLNDLVGGLISVVGVPQPLDNGIGQGSLDETTRLHTWTFEGCAGDLMVIDVQVGEGSETNPYILLAAPNGIIVGQDDDSGGGHNARLYSPLPMNGLYTIYVGVYTPGQYTVTVSLGEAAPTGGLSALAIGSQARVHTTQGDTLRVREEPSLNAPIVTYLANDAIVTILDGPHDAEGLVWWQVRTQSGHVGWVVEFIDGVQTLMPGGR